MLWNITQIHPLPHDLIAGDGFFLVRILTNTFQQTRFATFHKSFLKIYFECVVSKKQDGLLTGPPPKIAPNYFVLYDKEIFVQGKKEEASVRFLSHGCLLQTK